MIANELPEKIYVDTPNHDFWYRTKDSNSIEYTRTDAFIEKAVKYMANHFLTPGMDSEIEDFVNYMKGE